MKVSVVVTAFNDEKKLDDCLASVRAIASEIIVVNSSSTDNTLEVAKKYTDKIFTRENFLMLNKNKNFGFTKAAGKWILNLDSDERLAPELAEEIAAIPEDTEFNGFFIPRKNIIFGKWIKHTGWYPDLQLRLFRKGMGKFEEKHVHELLTVDGKVGNLKEHITHLNYQSISQFLDKMIRIYTVSEAESMILNGYVFNSSDIYRFPINEFVKRYFLQKGYKDGMHGLILSILMGIYHFVVFLRLWEAQGFREKDESLPIFLEGKKYAHKQISYWIFNEKIESEKNKLKKYLLKIRRKSAIK